MKFFVLSALALTSIQFCNGQVNVKIADNALQPSVAINPKNTSNIVIGCGTGHLSFSLDGGKTWQQGKSPFPPSPKGEAVLTVDSQGEFFFVHNNQYTDSVSRPLTIVVQSSRSGGKSWSNPVSVHASARNQTQPALYVHPKKGRLTVAWVEQDQLTSSDPGCQSNLFFSQSSDGMKWSDPELLSQESGDCGDHGILSPTILQDDEHKFYAGWARNDAVIMDRSYNDGKTWLNNDMPAFKIPGPSHIDIPGMGSLPRRVVMVQDNSRSVLKNSIYALWADQRNGADDTDIFFAVSTRRGDLWTSAVRVNQDEKGKHQFMPAMTVDDATGIIYAVYYDRRNYADNQTDVYLAWSKDGGAKFTEKKISETPFVPSSDKQFTDYLTVAAYKGVVVPVWVRTDNGVSSVWSTTVLQSSIIDAADVPRQVKPAGNQQRQTQKQF